MRKLKGKDLMIFADEGRGWKSVACSLSCEMGISEDAVITLSDKNWNWPSAARGKKNWTMSADCFVNTTEDPMRLLGQLVKVMIGSVPDYDIPGTRDADGRLRRYGDAVVTSIREIGEVKGMAKYHISFQGSGELKHDANPILHGAMWLDADLWLDADKWLEK